VELEPGQRDTVDVHAGVERSARQLTRTLMVLDELPRQRWTCG
jgi:hypothetical protein